LSKPRHSLDKHRSSHRLDHPVVGLGLKNVHLSDANRLRPVSVANCRSMVRYSLFKQESWTCASAGKRNP
jgi:hypothetical protein